MMLTEREKEIALQVAHRAAKKYRHKADEPYSFDDGCMIHAFDLFLSSIREEQEAVAWMVYDGEGFNPSISKQSDADFPLFTAPPAAPCDCDELVEELWRIKSHDCRDGVDAELMMNIASDAIANHAKLMKGGAQ